MEIKFLKAGTGDSILVHHKNHNILVDGGNDITYLLPEVDKIFHKGESIDLLVITHHDDDHIKGIIDLLNHIIKNNYNKEKPFITKLIFNSSKKVLELGESNNLSYKQANKIVELISETKTEHEICSDKNRSLNFSDLRIDFLSPSKEDIEEYSHGDGEYLSGDYRCDWDSTMANLEKYIDDDSQDKSISNKSSIVLNLQVSNKNVLLTGDVTPERFECILDKLTKQNNNNFIAFDIVKLPHHGSYRSLNKKILERIECNTFVISTNSKKHFLPNKRALLKVLKYVNRTDKKPIKFFFNYMEALENLNITSLEKKIYNFTLNTISPNDFNSRCNKELWCKNIDCNKWRS